MIRTNTWHTNLDALKVYVAEPAHFPDKHTRLNNRCRYQRNWIKAGTLPVKQRRLFYEVAESRFKGLEGRDNNVINK